VPTEARYRREICDAGRALRELGFLPAASGNLSVRLADGRILVTPSGAEKGRRSSRRGAGSGCPLCRRMRSRGSPQKMSEAECQTKLNFSTR